MPTNKAKEPPYQARPADIVMTQSEKKMGAMSIITKSQIKVWKAMLFSLFFAGAVGALAWAMALDQFQNSDAAWFRWSRNNVSEPVAETNIAPLATLKPNSFAMKRQDGSDGWNLFNSADQNSESPMVRTSRGEPPFVDLEFAGEPQEVKKISITLDTANQKYAQCGLREFTVMSSLDGAQFGKAFDATKSNTPGAEEFSFPAGWKAKVLRVIFTSNQGDPNWICPGRIKVIQ